MQFYFILLSNYKYIAEYLPALLSSIYHRYVSRVNVRDSSKHVILGTEQFKPQEFSTQINLSMDNAWGILRCIIDICMNLDNGKYLLMKDPNKVIKSGYLVNAKFSELTLAIVNKSKNTSRNFFRIDIQMLFMFFNNTVLP